MNTQEKKQLLNKAYEIGYNTFQNNGTIIPAHSKELRFLLKLYAVPVGLGKDVIIQFQKGFIESPMIFA